MSKLPEVIERDYMLFRAAVMHDVARVAAPRLAGSHLIRLDSEDDPQLLELAALLGISGAALLNKRKLRAKLRRFAHRLSVEKQAQLSALLGRWVRAPDEGISARWVEEQVEAIEASVDSWVKRAAVAAGSLAAGAAVALVAANQAVSPAGVREVVALTGAVAATRARAGASAAVLSLNTELLGNVAQANGVDSYRWVTQDDDRVRENHFDLHYTIQQWNDPPIGGGTKPDEEGHPGEGFGCRCIAEPLTPGNTQ